MKCLIVFEFFCVIEVVVLVVFNWIGWGNKNVVDDVVVKVMCVLFNKMEICGEIVIGEGEIDEVLMFYIGEKVGCFEL